MPEISKELIALLGFLAPGFIVAWVFYGFTPYEKPSQFERTVQALVFTVIIHAFVELERSTLELIGNLYSLGTWTPSTGITIAIVNALIFGFIISRLVHQDQIHKIATKFGLRNLCKTYLYEISRHINQRLTGVKHQKSEVMQTIPHKKVRLSK